MTSADIETTALTRVEQAKQITVHDAASYATASDYLLALRELRKEIDATFDPPIRAAHDAHKKALAAKERHAAAVRRAEGLVKAELLRYTADEAAKRTQLQRDLHAQALTEAEQRRTEEATELRAAGQTDRAQEVLQAPLDVPAVFVPPLQVDGVGTRDTYSAVVEDFRRLVNAVCASTVPLDAIEPNQTFLNRQARAQHDRLAYPGVRVEKTATVVVR